MIFLVIYNGFSVIIYIFKKNFDFKKEKVMKYIIEVLFCKERMSLFLYLDERGIESFGIIYFF